MKKFNVINHKAVKYDIVIIEQGDKYGLNNCLINSTGKNLIEFYHNDYFIARYNQDIIMQIETGLCINENHSIDYIAIEFIQHYLKNSLQS